MHHQTATITALAALTASVTAQPFEHYARAFDYPSGLELIPSALQQRDLENHFEDELFARGFDGGEDLDFDFSIRDLAMDDLDLEDLYRQVESETASSSSSSSSESTTQSKPAAQSEPATQSGFNAPSKIITRQKRASPAGAPKPKPKPQSPSSTPGKPKSSGGFGGFNFLDGMEKAGVLGSGLGDTLNGVSNLAHTFGWGVPAPAAPPAPPAPPAPITVRKRDLYAIAYDLGRRAAEAEAEAEAVADPEPEAWVEDDETIFWEY